MLVGSICFDNLSLIKFTKNCTEQQIIASKHRLPTNISNLRKNSLKYVVHFFLFCAPVISRILNLRHVLQNRQGAAPGFQLFFAVLYMEDEMATILWAQMASSAMRSWWLLLPLTRAPGAKSCVASSNL